ncbi:chemotaxis protein CheY [Thiopseudomonas alkaliphila]|uniref:response regulator transcription factor n=1 Tax=Thiopseudomonas alkaliphila TaxID=1697053 RepID=UPI00069CE822|nr:response regulator transcription factor [Thiopseudomonas alkaliphila]AKX44131.1 chemotaxis protein CheY [Thiopseudomonas alkaliphila]AKX46365.1 chemotaxis protein CheY [Thiopseudomonas alkaliphila]AKX49436.1 chemotaxis protein CheY [Thiopseudomonas alkaliphila]AKX50189.1 chemotaxis protein CheY [Thiopseudomonas alkaliphila]AKX52655.1 chemotaxis protein CheY [Thiopseudomonas alkaliphila]
MQQLLLIDDDVELCELLGAWLSQEGYQVFYAHSTQHARQLLSTEASYDLVILDVMLPDGNGLELLKELRENLPQLPVLMLSARGEPMDRVLGLELGADDYLAKPCDPRELSARLKAIYRRIQSTTEDNTKALEDWLEYGDLRFQRSTGNVLTFDQQNQLTVSEGRLLDLLLSRPGEVWSKDELSEQALEKKLTAFDRSLDMHISNLRKKLGNLADGSSRIQALRGRGYFYVKQ